MNRALQNGNASVFAKLVESKAVRLSDALEYVPLLLNQNPTNTKALDDLLYRFGPARLSPYKNKPALQAWAGRRTKIYLHTAQLSKMDTLLKKIPLHKTTIRAVIDNGFLETLLSMYFLREARGLEQHTKALKKAYMLAASASSHREVGAMKALVDAFIDNHNSSPELIRRFWRAFDLLKQSGADPNKVLLNVWNTRGSTPVQRTGTVLHHAINLYLTRASPSSYLNSMQLLAGMQDRGVKMDAIDSHGDTAMHYAAAQTGAMNNMRVIAAANLLEQLVVLGASSTIRNRNGQTPRNLAPSQRFLFAWANIKKRQRGAYNFRASKKTRR
jgi:hypothetical protein